MNYREIAALLLFAASFLASLLLVKLASRRPIGLLWPVALGFLIAYHALALNILSIFHAVTPGGSCLSAAVLFVSSALGLVVSRRGRPFSGFQFGRLVARQLASLAHGPYLLVAPLAILLAVIAVAWSPSNWDSMTYHMARVAHWIQNQSVAYFPTSNDRQNWFGPGAEYLLLDLQLLSGTDLWANSLQLGAWLLCLITVSSIARLAGVPRSLCPWASIFATTAPMAILQATSSQNDLVAAALALGLLTATIPLLHRRQRWRPVDLAILAIMLSAAALTKPTAILAVSPALALAASQTIGDLSRRALARRPAVLALWPALFLAFLILGPDTYRKLNAPPPSWVLAEIFYPPVGEFRSRLFNIAAGAAHHAEPRPVLMKVLDGFRITLSLPPLTSTTGPAPAGTIPIYAERVNYLQEDYVGNPWHMLAGLLFALGILALVSRSTKRAAVFALIPTLGWLIFHWFVRDNPFLSRLQLPLFVLGPLMWGVCCTTGAPLARTRRLGLIAIGFVLSAQAYISATHIMGKELNSPSLPTIDRDSCYYQYRPSVKPSHDAMLAELASRNCNRLGLYILGDAYDYPLTWRAMRAGATVKHYVAPSRWPCLIFSDRGVPPAADARSQWVSVSQDGIYINAERR